MGLDVRVPVGLLFSVIGLALALYGLSSDPRLYERSLGVNVNLWWGLVLLAFGATMLLLSRRAPGLTAPKPPSVAKPREKTVAR
jgi:hypothetical protein